MKLVLTLLALTIVSMSVIGCHASADVDPHGSTYVVPGR